MPRPATSSTACSSRTRPASRRRRKPAARKQGQFAAALQHVPQLHGRQPERAQQEPQSAEALERGEIGVLHGEEIGQPLAGRLGGKAVVAQVRSSAFRTAAVRSGGLSTRKNR